MLDAETLKPYLLHEDRYVRSAASRYFYDGWSRDVELVPLILTACERFGHADNSLALSCCHRFPLTESAFACVLRDLAEADEPNIAMHLSNMAAWAPLDLLRTSAILDDDRLQDEYRPIIRRRLDLATWSGERLWDELQISPGVQHTPSTPARSTMAMPMCSLRPWGAMRCPIQRPSAPC